MRKCLTCRKATEELDSRWDRIRQWFFNRFHQDIVDLSQDKFTQGFGDGYKVGFKHAQETAQKTIEAIREELLKKSNAHTPLLQELDETLILTTGKNEAGQTVLFLGGVEVPSNQAQQLKVEAAALTNLQLWKVFQETFKNTAYKTMFEKSKSFDDMKTGKGFLYALDLLNNIVKILQNFKPKS